MNELLINIGTEKSCLFVQMSTFLIRQLEEHVLLYYAVEEALECAKIGYYGIGIVAFAQILNLFNEKTPESRHIVAHQLLRNRPTQEMFESAVQEFKSAAKVISDQECQMYASVDLYQRRISGDWIKLMKKLRA